MPRLRLSRSCRLLFYAWLSAVALWSFLPSPIIQPEHVRRHIDSTLNAGLALTTLVTESTFSEGYFIIRWKLLQQPGANGKGLVLQIGDNPGIDLAELLDKSDKTHFSTSKNRNTRTPWFEHTQIEFELPWIRKVDCSDVCLPWFDRNDKILFTYQLHGGMQKVEMRFVVDDRGVIEVWPASYVQTTLAELKGARKKPEAATYEEGDLLEEALGHLHQIGHPLIQIYAGDKETTQDVMVPYLRGSLPSRMHHIRKTLLAKIEPVIYIMVFPVCLLTTRFSTVLKTLFFILSQGGLACAGITLSCWLKDGRPPFSRSRNFWMTKWMYLWRRKSQDVWGPAGPVDAKPKDRGPWTAKGSFGLQKPKTARFGRTWDAV